MIFIDGLRHFEGCGEAPVAPPPERVRALGSDLEFNFHWILTFVLLLFVSLCFSPIKYNLN